MYPRYALPAGLISRVALSVVTGRARSFGADARVAVGGLRPPLTVLGGENLPAAGPCLLTVNHYYRPGFQAWWIPLALSSIVPCDVHWVMTSAWTYTDPLGVLVFAPVMRWLLGRLARVYGFTTMPPEAAEVAGRAQGVRRVLTRARGTPQAVIGLAPEGRDAPGGVLQWPPSGGGRFISHLAALGLRVVPVGAYEVEPSLCLRVGSAYELDLSPDLPPDERDRHVSEQVMRHIAVQLPLKLQGEFA
jgi:1-acyl-sn-glycerol-3-phosphate acyltransferase